MNWNWRTVPVQHGKCVSTSGRIWPTVWLWTEKLHPTIRVRSYWNLRVKKNPHSLSRDLFKFLQDHMRFSSFVTTCLAVLAFYPNSGNGRTRRPDITILHLRIHIVLLWLKTSTASFFFNKNSFYDPPTPFSLSSFFMRFLQNILYMYIQISAFCLLPFFWQT